MFDLSGRTVLVTGASSGLGRHFSRLAAQHGASVILAARRVEALEELRDEIARVARKAEVLRLDVSDAAEVASQIGALRKAPDIVINNAGVNASKPAMDLSEEDWDHVLDTNLKGAFLVAQTSARRMKAEERSGSIVNLASILGLRVGSWAAAYAASKAGLVQLTKGLALEWARYGIRVNALCPGYVETDINRDFFASDAGSALIKRVPQRRLGEMAELDGALLLFASDAGSYITGATLAVDGGHLVSTL